MKAGKLAALTFGGGILLFEIAHHKGYIKINWDKVMKTADDVIDKIDEEVSGKNSSAMDKVIKFFVLHSNISSNCNIIKK